MLTFSEEPFLPDLEVPGEAFGSGAMGVFACLVLVLVPPWVVVGAENESLRNVVEPLRAFVFVSEPALWLCLRGLEVVPGDDWDDWVDCELDGDAVGVLEGVILPCNAAHERTDDSESFLCGWRRPSGLCLGSLASLDMAQAGLRGNKRRKKRLYE